MPQQRQANDVRAKKGGHNAELMMCGVIKGELVGVEVVLPFGEPVVVLCPGSRRIASLGDQRNMRFYDRFGHADDR